MDTTLTKRTSLTPAHFFLVCCGLAMPFLLSCIGKDQNPYSDPSRAAVIISPSYFYSNDSTASDSIFETFSFSVSLDLPQQIKTVIIHAGNNRLWKNGDSTLEGSSLAAVVWPARFPVSFSDTGWDTLWVKACLQNGDTISSVTGRIYSRTPLHQDNLADTLGAVITLRTKPVSDTVDYYIWDLGNNIKPIVSEICSTTYNTRNSGLVTSGILSGKLYVESGSISSSPTQFTLALGDSSAPEIVPVNDSVAQNHTTIYTGDPFPSVQFRITDNSGQIASAAINGTPFDSCDSGASVYMKNLRRVDTLKTGLQLIVSAADPSHNTRTDTFSLVYSSSIPSQNPVIEFSIPNLDSSISQVKSTSVAGIVKNSSQFSSLVLLLSVNKLTVATQDTVTPDDNSWAWNLTLSPGPNTLTVTAMRILNSIVDTITMSSRVMVYDSSLNDKTPPVILEILADSSIVDTVSNTFVTSDSMVLIDVMAYDAGSGIRTVLCNGVAMKLAGSSHYQLSIPMTGNKSGNVDTISAVDNDSNTCTRIITGIRNLLGQDSVNFSSPYTLVKAHACTVSVPLRLSYAAVSAVRISLGISSSDSLDSDYVLLTPQMTFNAGDSIDSARVQVNNDSTCKPLDSIRLSVVDAQGALRGSKSSSIIALMSDSLNCKQRVLLVIGDGTSFPLDNQLRDTLSSDRYAVTVIKESAISTWPAYNPDLIFLSRSITGNSCGPLLHTAQIPVVCAHSSDYLPLELADSADTTTVSTSRVLEKAFDANGNPTKFNATASAITSQLANFTCIEHSPGIGISIASPYKLQDTTKTIILYFDKESPLRNGTSAPARRAAFCMTDLNTDPSYTEEWWKLLKLTVQWTVEP